MTKRAASEFEPVQTFGTGSVQDLTGPPRKGRKKGRKQPLGFAPPKPKRPKRRRP